MPDYLKAPFPWFGGKRRVAAEVWAGLSNENRHKERLWFSPHCLEPQPVLPF